MEKVDKKANETTSIRLNEKDRQALRIIMKNYGFRSVSGCLRMLITKEADRIESERRHTTW